ncbi:MAG: SRPBCC family protein [Pseudomonadales bacterium]
MTLEAAPIATTQMLIRRPQAEVFEALVDPAVTTRFWFTRSSGRLESGATVRWDWEMYGASTAVRVVALEPLRRVLLHWGEPPRPLEFVLEARADGTTLVRVCDSGFAGSDDEQVAQAIDSMGGFASMLAGMKAWLEHGLALNLVADHHPDAHQTAG